MSRTDPSRWNRLLSLTGTAAILLMLVTVSPSGCAVTPVTEQPEVDPDELITKPAVLLSEPMSYEVNGEDRTGHLARFDNLTQAPMIVVIPDHRGHDAWLDRRITDFAKMGYVVVCADVAGLSENARDKQVADNISAAIDEAVKQVQYTSPPRIGVIGWSVGGTHALTCARLLELDAVVICYGQLLAREEALLTVLEPVLGIFGGQDPSIPMTRIVAFKEAMRRVGGMFDGNVWQDEGHDFIRLPIDPTHSREAEFEIVGWFDDHLKP